MTQHTMINSATTKPRHQSAIFPVLLMIAGFMMLLLALGMLLPDNPQGVDQEVAMLGGGSVNFQDYEGQVLLVNFWASWCPPCREEMPALQAFYDQYQSEGFALLMINSEESLPTVNNYMAQTGYTFPVGLDIDGRISNTFEIYSLPISLIYDRNGELVYRHTGYFEPQVLSQTVLPLLQ